ncbi:MAG TPA: ribosome silencing factor [Syntrophorhabdales bacterium]|nr:ribosome silencing factor [Syntrophorhabdales bacterium]
MEANKKALVIGKLADEKKAKGVVVLHLAGLSDITDFFVLASGTSERHVRTVAEGVQAGMKEKGMLPLSAEGFDEGRWIILDYGDVVFHAFLESLRELYDLESLWIEAPKFRTDEENKILEV